MARARADSIPPKLAKYYRDFEKIIKLENVTLVLYKNIPNKQKKVLLIPLNMQVIAYQATIELCLPSVKTNRYQKKHT